MAKVRQAGRRQTRTVDELAALLEDAWSAVAGSTVLTPAIYRIESTLGGPNWTVDIRQLDDSMIEAVRQLQARYELKTTRPSWWRFLLGLAKQQHRRADLQFSLMKFHHDTVHSDAGV